MRRQLTRARMLAAVLAAATGGVGAGCAGASAPTVTTGAASAGDGERRAARCDGQPERRRRRRTRSSTGPRRTTARRRRPPSAGSGIERGRRCTRRSSGLVSGTTYHYRVVATNPSGTNSGSDMTFTTAKPRRRSRRLARRSSRRLGDARRHGRPEGQGDDVLVPVRADRELRPAEPGDPAGVGLERGTVHVGGQRPAPGTTYHYRLVAMSADGTAASADATFSTTGNQATPGGPLPVVSESAAVGLTTSSVQLNGAINPEGPTTSWYFQYGLSGYYGVQTSPQTMSGLGARPVNATVSGLQSGTTYHFRLVAVSANGLYVGPDHTFTTKQAGRAHPRMLSLRASVHRRNGAVRLVIAGSLGLPGTVPAASGCTGRGRDRDQGAVSDDPAAPRVPALQLQLPADRERLGRARSRHASRLGISGRFEGNAMLRRDDARRSVRV